jgi:hypothetical protein
MRRPLPKGARNGEPSIFTDWRKDRKGTEARLRAISDALVDFAVASRARLAELDSEGGANNG